MKPTDWEKAPASELQTVEGVCLDIDDTLTTRGKLTDSAFQALWDLHRSGLTVVPVTGRPAGWCDHIARFWPVNAVIGENGAFTFFMDAGVRKRLETPGADPQRKIKLEDLGRKIQARFPKARWASDQRYREYDLAIDICEDVPAWKSSEVDELINLCESLGAHVKLSSIHVNAWFGEFDKRLGFAHWLNSGAPGIDSGKIPARDKWLFIGDSPNDEPLFESFPFSVGVSNLNKYLDRLKSPPRWITRGESGEGFEQMAKLLIQSR